MDKRLIETCDMLCSWVDDLTSYRWWVPVILIWLVYCLIVNVSSSGEGGLDEQKKMEVELRKAQDRKIIQDYSDHLYYLAKMMAAISSALVDAGDNEWKRESGLSSAQECDLFLVYQSKIPDGRVEQSCVHALIDSGKTKTFNFGNDYVVTVTRLPKIYAMPWVTNSILEIYGKAFVTNDFRLDQPSGITNLWDSVGTTNLLPFAYFGITNGFSKVEGLKNPCNGGRKIAAKNHLKKGR